MRHIQTVVCALLILLGVGAWIIAGSQMDAVILLLLAILIKPSPEQESEREKQPAAKPLEYARREYDR